MAGKEGDVSIDNNGESGLGLAAGCTVVVGDDLEPEFVVGNTTEVATH